MHYMNVKQKAHLVTNYHLCRILFQSGLQFSRKFFFFFFFYSILHEVPYPAVVNSRSIQKQPFFRGVYNYNSSYVIFQMVQRFQRGRFFRTFRIPQNETISNGNSNLGFTLYIRNSNLTVFFQMAIYYLLFYIYKHLYLQDPISTFSIFIHKSL